MGDDAALLGLLTAGQKRQLSISSGSSGQMASSAGASSGEHQPEQKRSRPEEPGGEVSIVQVLDGLNEDTTQEL
eukprot:8641011-Alexandrium_andersonii.AAC.1